MKIKHKLRLGFGFLFLAVIFFGATSLYYINTIARSAKTILKNNYETLDYAKSMRTIVDENPLPLNAVEAAAFTRLLQSQEHNITEKGEREATRALRLNFAHLIAGSGRDSLMRYERLVRQNIRAIETLNMQAIIRKDDRAKAAVNNATVLLGFIGALTFLVLFSFSVNFPDIIAGPLRALLAGIQEISHKNYGQRLNFDRNDEFGELAAAFNDMAARLNEWENSNLAKVMSEKRRIETIIEQMQDAIIGINERQEILFINDKARSLLNLNDNNVVGQNMAELMKSNELFQHVISRQSTLKPLKIVVDGKEAFYQLESRSITVPNLNPGRADTISVTASPAGMVYVLRNVTEFKEHDEAKSNFIATISHELKTPISSIKMSLQLLKDERIGAMNEEQRQLTNHIQEDNNRLLKITSELLDLSQVETGNIQLNFVPVKPVHIVDYALNAVQFQAGQKGIKLDFMPDNLLPAVNADVEKTAWVLINFLSNALRYSPEKAQVVIRAVKRGNQVEFSVQDQGKGIDEQYQKRLFDRYFQVPTDGQNKSGSGLGLAISKDFIEAQNGKIWVQSAVGEGSTFSFSLPVA